MNFFWIDNKRDLNVDYMTFFKEVLREGQNNIFILEKNPYLVFLSLLRNLACGQKSILLDSDFSREELQSLELSEEAICQGSYYQNNLNSKFNNYEDLLEYLKNEENQLQIEIFTSGTAGRPKRVKQTLKNITRAVKIDKAFKNKVWGFAYNPTHFAGLQVFFQAFSNKNTIVYLFNKDYLMVYEDLVKHKITHLSCTPTFMKMLLPNMKNKVKSMESLTFGGEKFDRSLENRIKEKFTQSIINNVYASTEAGSLLKAEGEYFVIPNRYVDLIKIEDNELLIHKELLGVSSSFYLVGSWYKTGDLVKLEDDKRFKFVSRKSDMINVGGYKVNPSEVEEVIIQIEGVKNVYVFGRKNSVLGNIVIANIIKEDSFDETELMNRVKKVTQDQLQQFKIPRKINFVDSFNLTRTGKIKKI
ncbi:ANL family adenylate-forming protein [Tenacibaculum ascidiaceicola]|uniref:ANL family adenylate-forming protein n=1 Tax=Tenacibaculum ascidiaceicola TaxID=1699411 RepID=UPI003CE5784B